MDGDQALGIIASIVGIVIMAQYGLDFGRISIGSIAGLVIFVIGLYFAIRKL